MRRLFFLINFLLMTNTFAESVASFQFDFTLTSVMTGETIASVDCEVRQVLQWGNSPNVFKCDDTISGNTFLIKNVSGVIGYSYQKNAAYTKYYLSGHNGLVTTILKSVESNLKVESAAMAEFIFYNHAPVINSEELLLNTSGDDALLLNVRELQYLD